MDYLLQKDEQSKVDFTFLSHSQEQCSLLEHLRTENDDVQNIIQRIRQLQNKSKQLSKYIELIRARPEEVKNNPTGDLLKQKICRLRSENDQLRELVHMTKKPIKGDIERLSFNKTPRNNLENQENMYGRQSFKSYRRRGGLEEIDNDYEKVFTEVSTCQNYVSNRPEIITTEEQHLKRIEPLTDTEQRIKNGLKLEIKAELEKEEIVKKELKEIQTENSDIYEHKVQNIKNIKIIEEYKNKLLQELKKSTAKQHELKKLVEEFQKNYNSSVERFKQLAEILQIIKQNTDANQVNSLNQIQIVERYQQALRLQAILTELTPEYERVKQLRDREANQSNSHLKNIKNELLKILHKLGLKVSISNMNHEQAIEVICNEIINNVYIPGTKSMSNTNSKLLKLKQLSQLEIKNNNRIITELKSKEQALSRQLMELKMQNSNS